MISVIFRFVVRFHTRKKPALDDYLVLLAAVAVSAATGLLLQNLDTFYLSEAIFKLFLIPTTTEVDALLDIMKWLHAIAPLVWLTLYAVKFAFLYFFHRLVISCSKWLRIYFWGVVVFVFISWLSSSLSMVVLCPKIGLDSCEYSLNTYFIVIVTDSSSGMSAHLRKYFRNSGPCQHG